MRYLTFALTKGRLAKKTLEMLEQQILELSEKIRLSKRDVKSMKSWILDSENAGCVCVDMKRQQKN